MFVLGGGLCFIYDIIATFILTEIVGVWYLASYFFALSTGIIFLFIYHMRVTFGKSDNVKRRFAKFVFVATVYLFLNTWLVYFITETYKLHYLKSVILVTTVLSILNYLVNKKWVFRHYGLKSK